MSLGISPPNLKHVEAIVRSSMPPGLLCGICYATSHVVCVWSLVCVRWLIWHVPLMANVVGNNCDDS